MSDKSDLIKELNRILMVHDVNWQLLPREDLSRLVSAFRRLKSEVDEVFNILDEVLDQAPSRIEDKKRWREYTT